LQAQSRPEAQAYRLIPEKLFPEPATTYSAKTADGDEARADPNGFYHGIKIQFKGAASVLCGPPSLFVAEQSPERPEGVPEPEQMSLFP
jgi:hypothetical protein